MPTIDLDFDTYQKLMVSARLMDRPVGDVVRLLVHRLVAPPGADTSPSLPDSSAQEAQMADQTFAHPGWMPVYKTYRSQMVEGEFNPATMELRVVTAPWSGKVFPSPTAAARSVVERLGTGDRQTSNTNGRKFWRLKGGGGDLRSVVGTRL